MSPVPNCKEITNIYPPIVERGELVTWSGVTRSSLENRNNAPDVSFATCVRGLETAEHGGITEAGGRRREPFGSLSVERRELPACACSAISEEHWTSEAVLWALLWTCHCLGAGIQSLHLKKKAKPTLISVLICMLLAETTRSHS